MDYFQQRITTILESDFENANYDKKRVVPALCEFSRKLKASLSRYPGLGENLYIHYIRARDQRSILVFRSTKTNSYLALKYYPKDGDSAKKQPVKVLGINGYDALIILKLISRDIHGLFDELGTYFAIQYPDYHINYIFDTSTMVGALSKDMTMNEGNKCLEDEAMGGMNI